MLTNSTYFNGPRPGSSPRAEFGIPVTARRWIRSIPGLVEGLRASIYLVQEALGLALVHPSLTPPLAALDRWTINRSIEDPELREVLTPKYSPGCKRILMSNSYYPTLARPDVKVIPDAVRSLPPHAVLGNNGARRTRNGRSQTW